MELMNEDNSLKKPSKLVANPQSNDVANYYVEHENLSGEENSLIEIDDHAIISNELECEADIKRKKIQCLRNELKNKNITNNENRHINDMQASIYVIFPHILFISFFFTSLI